MKYLHIILYIIIALVLIVCGLSILGGDINRYANQVFCIQNPQPQDRDQIKKFTIDNIPSDKHLGIYKEKYSSTSNTLDYYVNYYIYLPSTDEVVRFRYNVFDTINPKILVIGKLGDEFMPVFDPKHDVPITDIISTINGFEEEFIKQSGILIKRDNRGYLFNLYFYFWGLYGIKLILSIILLGIVCKYRVVLLKCIKRIYNSS